MLSDGRRGIRRCRGGTVRSAGSAGPVTVFRRTSPVPSPRGTRPPAPPAGRVVPTLSPLRRPAVTSRTPCRGPGRRTPCTPRAAATPHDGLEVPARRSRRGTRSRARRNPGVRTGERTTTAPRRKSARSAPPRRRGSTGNAGKRAPRGAARPWGAGEHRSPRAHGRHRSDRRRSRFRTGRSWTRTGRNRRGAEPGRNPRRLTADARFASTHGEGLRGSLGLGAVGTRFAHRVRSSGEVPTPRVRRGAATSRGHARAGHSPASRRRNPPAHPDPRHVRGVRNGSGSRSSRRSET